MSEIRPGWTVMQGPPEEIERLRKEVLQKMTPQERLDYMMALNRAWKGIDVERIELVARGLEFE